MDLAFFMIIRDQYTEKETLGNVFLNYKEFGYSLENVVRAAGIKVKGLTAINAGLYKLSVKENSEGEEKLYVDDVMLFTYIQCHGGNTVDDSNGCPLIARNRFDITIQGTLEKEMIAIVKNAHQSYLRIENLNQLQP